MKVQYIQAVLELLERDTTVAHTEEIISKLKAVLAARGHGRLLPSILRGVAKRLEHAAPSAVVVTLREASDVEYEKYKELITASGLDFDEQSMMLTEDPTMIGGFTLTVDDRMIDNSYKNQLLTLYRNITT